MHNAHPGFLVPGLSLRVQSYRGSGKQLQTITVGNITACTCGAANAVTEYTEWHALSCLCVSPARQCSLNQYSLFSLDRAQSSKIGQASHQV